jgi:hypothetical protein
MTTDRFIARSEPSAFGPDVAATPACLCGRVDRAPTSKRSSGVRWRCAFTPTPRGGRGQRGVAGSCFSPISSAPTPSCWAPSSFPTLTFRACRESEGAGHIGVEDCYGRGAFGRKFFEDNTVAPAWLSPSKGVTGPPPGPKQTSSSFGSANHTTTWFRSLRTRVFPSNAKASSITASTRTDPLPAAFVVNSAIYSDAPKGNSASSVRKTVKLVLGGSRSAFKSRVSTPWSSSFGKTVIVADAFEKHVVDVATKLNLKGSAL